MRLWTRQANDMAREFARITAAVTLLKPASLTIDGEAVVLRPDGHSDFHALQSRQAREAVLIGFDLIEHDGEDLRELPMEARQERLQLLISGDGDGLRFSETFEAEGEVVFEHACAMGLEGIVSKRRGSRYQSGRSRHWLKTKNAGFVRR